MEADEVHSELNDKISEPKEKSANSRALSTP